MENEETIVWFLILIVKWTTIDKHSQRVEEIGDDNYITLGNTDDDSGKWIK